MRPPPPTLGHDTATAELDGLLASWRRHLAAQRMSPATLSTYSTSVAPASRFLAEQGMPHVAAGDPSRARRGVHHRPPRALEAGDRPQPLPRARVVLPLAGRRGRDPREPDGAHEAAAAPETPPPVLREAELKRLLAACAARQDVRRPPRRGDPHGVHRHRLPTRRGPWADARRRRPRRGELRVTGKGQRTRLVADRSEHGPDARSLPPRPRQAARRHDSSLVARQEGTAPRVRAGRAGPRPRPQGGDPGPCPPAHVPPCVRAPRARRGCRRATMALAGWRTREMVTRYAASTRQERALAAARA